MPTSKSASTSPSMTRLTRCSNGWHRNASSPWRGVGLSLIEEALEYRKTSISRESPMNASAARRSESPTTRRGSELADRVSRECRARRHSRLVRGRAAAHSEGDRSKLGSYPVEFGKPLRYSFKGARRLRVGDHRVIYRIEPPDVVLVVRSGIAAMSTTADWGSRRSDFNLFASNYPSGVHNSCSAKSGLPLKRRNPPRRSLPFASLIPGRQKMPGARTEFLRYL